MDLALSNLQRLICHKTQPTNQRVMFYKQVLWSFFLHVYSFQSWVIGHGGMSKRDNVLLKSPLQDVKNLLARLLQMRQ